MGRPLHFGRLPPEPTQRRLPNGLDPQHVEVRNVIWFVPLAQLQAVERERDAALLAKGGGVSRFEILTTCGLHEVALSNPAVMRQWGELTIRAETAEDSLAAAREALANIRELNMTAEYENGHRWANSDLIEQEIYAALAGSNPK